MNYNNEICQGCGEKLSDSDDIVVCPECGTPQHRKCYQKENKCVNEHLHSEGYEWKPRHDQPENAPVSGERNGRPCSFCGHVNPDDAIGCENCGQPFEVMGRLIFTPNKDESENSDEGNVSYGAHFVSGETCGISNRDLGVYIRTSVDAYKEKFEKIEKKKPTFNFGAFIFGYIWYFFRKMYKQGFAFLLLTVCLTIGFYNPINEVYDSLSATMEPIQQQLQQVQSGEIKQSDIDEDAILAEMQSQLEGCAPVLIVFLSCRLLLNLAAALLADRSYRKKCIGEIKDINTRCATDDRARLGELLRLGGTSFTFAVGGYFLQSIIVSIITGVILK